MAKISVRLRSERDVESVLKNPPQGGDVFVWDQAMPGFGIRFRAGRQPAYFVKWEINGRSGKMSLGQAGKVTLDYAKSQARAQFDLIDKDINPAIEAAKRAVAGIVFKDKIEAYLAKLARDGRVGSYVADNKRSLDRHFKGLHKFAFKELATEDGRALIAAELNKLLKNGRGKGGALRNARAHLHAYMDWCAGEGLLSVNQVSFTNKPENGRRDRVLDPAEIGPLWRLLPKDDFGAVCKLLWLTWARRDEIGQLRKCEVDRDKKVIYLPGKRMVDGKLVKRTKNGLDHVIPLSRQAWAILEPKLDQREGEFVFGYGKGGLGGWDKPVKRLREALGKKVKPDASKPDLGSHFTLHDFRRSARSLGREEPVNILPHLGEAILNHVSSKDSGKAGVAGTYDVHKPWQYFDGKAEALQAWADYLEDLVSPKQFAEAA